jgi:ABC-type Fe3+/spermidine/putrescine transport system ATPase subunit
VSITLQDVTKRYGDQIPVDRVSLEVEKGELFVLLGASGSGKSTILRMIAGLVYPDEGVIRIGDRDVTYLPPQARDLGLVFQNYSIFRHMTVGENVEFGLRIRGVKAAERHKRRDELLDLVGLGGLGNRYESQLSGGQRQRVALARALAYRPGVLLLDEPFGALDVKIRVQLRQSLKEIQQRLGLTTVLVTHDQEEAFELGTRIAVIERGRLLEVGKPQRLYESPRSLFVATFLGAGAVLVGRSRGHDVDLGPLTLPIPMDVPHEEGDRVRVLIRPEHIALSEEKKASAPTLGQGEVIEETFTGSVRRIRVRLPPLAGVRQVVPAPPFGEEAVRLDVAVPAHADPAPRKPWVSLEEWHILRQPTPRLLVCDAGEGLAPALEFAGPLLAALNGVATVVGVASDARRQDALRESLAQRAAAADLKDASVRVRRGEPVEQILLEQRDAPYDFVIVGAGEVASLRGRTRKRAPELAEELALSTSIPLLAVRGRPRPFTSILICTAVGEPGKSDVRAGGWLARRTNATATLLHVRRPGHATPYADAHLDRGVSTVRELGVTGRWAMREDEDPVAGILAFLRDNPHDLVVVGAPSRHLRLPARGETITTRVLRECGTSILVVPEGSW